MSIHTTSQRTAAGTRIVLTERGRFVRTALIVAALALTGLYLMSGQTVKATSTLTPAGMSYETVMSGETLWSIAERVAPNRDPRDWIADAVALNGLTSANIPAGTRIALPAN